MASSRASPSRSEPPWACWLTGLPAAGKTTLARALVAALRGRGWDAVMFDGDEVRAAIGAHGFSRADRAAQAQRLAAMAAGAMAAGRWPVVAAVSPYRADRAAAFAAIGRAIEIHVSTAAEVCAARDPRGLYAAARRGELRGLTGVDDPYEIPEHPALRYDAANRSEQAGVADVLDLFHRRCMGVSLMAER